jgi:hypothetical protein
VTLFTELLKFLVSVTMAVLVSRARPVYRRMDLDSGEMKDDGGDGEHRHGSEQSQQRSPLSLKYHIRYMFPGLCYFATNNIYFFVLGIFDPAGVCVVPLLLLSHPTQLRRYCSISI